MIPRPYISVVVVGRNDDYGQGFVQRLDTFVRSLDHQAKACPGVFELVIVEWNPPSDRENLYQSIAPPQHLDLRVIQVPQELHQSLGVARSVLEFHGKNVGARRARGDFVLTTNPDVLFSNDLIAELARRRLRTDVVYRTDRYDFDATGIDQVATAQLERFALDRTFVMHGIRNQCSVSISITPGTPQISHLPTSDIDMQIPHTNAAGDFLLASREAFYTVRGLYESKQLKWHVDSISLLRFFRTKMRQQVFLAPCCIFHQHHERATPDISFQEVDWDQVLNEHGDTSWGLSGHQLTEFNKEETPTWPTKD